jgi:hypothetical protein
MDRELGHGFRIRRGVASGVVAILLTACGGSGDVGPAADGLCADVVGVTVEGDAGGAATVTVTVRSDDVGWEGYADRWEIVSGDEVVAVRVLTHPHVEEQPFTRSLRGVDLPAGSLSVRAHHSTGGFCGSEMALER